MTETGDPRQEAVIAVTELILAKAVACSGSSAAEELSPVQQQQQTQQWNPTQITELVSAIASHPFDAFVACHRHLHEAVVVYCQTEEKEPKDGHKLASKQLKLCLIERDESVHSCMNKLLISVFQVHKNSTSSAFVTVDAQLLLPKIFDFLTSFTCISQLTNLLDLFNLAELDAAEDILPYAKAMIDQNCLVHASIVINRFDIHGHVDSNSMLLELLHEDNFLDIEAYLQLDTLQLSQSTVLPLLDCDSNNDSNSESCLAIEDRKRNKQIQLFIEFMRYLDMTHATEDAYKLLPVFERLLPNKRKQFLKKISRFVFDLFKRPNFAPLDDATLTSLCPNITKYFYAKQLSGLFYRFKDESVPMSPHVIGDHVNALRGLTIGSYLVPQAHEYALSIYARRNDFDSASEYISIQSKHETIYSNLFSSEQSSSRGNNNTLWGSAKGSPDVTPYSTKLSVSNGGIGIIETEDQFTECMKQIQVFLILSR